MKKEGKIRTNFIIDVEMIENGTIILEWVPTNSLQNEIKSKSLPLFLTEL